MIAGFVRPLGLLTHYPLCLTNTHSRRTFGQLVAAMSVLASEKVLVFRGFFGGPLETRTPDPLIKSQLLYQLS